MKAERRVTMSLITLGLFIITGLSVWGHNNVPIHIVLLPISHDAEGILHDSPSPGQPVVEYSLWTRQASLLEGFLQPAT